MGIKNKIIRDVEKLSSKGNHIWYLEDNRQYIIQRGMSDKYDVILNLDTQSHNTAVISILDYISSNHDETLSFYITVTQGKNGNIRYSARGKGMRENSRISESLAKDIFEKYGRKAVYTATHSVEYLVILT